MILCKMDSSNDESASDLDEEAFIAVTEKPSKQRKPSTIPIEPHSVQACHRPTAASELKSVNDEEPSTSREKFYNQDVQSAGPNSLKRKVTANSELHKDPKIQRFTPNDASPSLSNCEDPDNTASTKTIEIPQIRESDEEIIRTGLNNEETSVAHAGIGSVSHGLMYQIKHLMLVSIRALEMGYPFRLATEMEAAETFDDLVLQYENNTGDKIHRFVQLKHKQDGTQLITASDLLADMDGAFSVKKYFNSWRKIKQHSAFSGSISKDFILCTNMGLDIKGLEKANIGVSKIGEPDDFLEVKDAKKEPLRYKLIANKHSKLYNKLKTVSDIHQLAPMMGQHVRNSRRLDLRTDIFKRYHVALAQEIIDVRNNRFSDNFIKNKNLSEKAKRFRELFLAQLLFDEHVSANDVPKHLEKYQLKLSCTFGMNPQCANKSELEPLTELPNDHIDDAEIADFLNIFTLAVDQPNEVELGEIIKREMGEISMFNLLDANLVMDSFQKLIVNWCKDKSGVFLKGENVQAFFMKIKGNLRSVTIKGLTLYYLKILKKCGIAFERQNEKLLNFLNGSGSTRTSILQLLSTKQSLMTALRVHQTLKQREEYRRTDSFIFMHLEKLLLPKITKTVLHAFKNSRNHNLLIIDCGLIIEKPELWDQLSKTVAKRSGKKIILIQELWDQLGETVAKSSGKKVILIIQGNNNSAVKFKICSEISHEKDDDISIINMTTCSRQKLLKKKIIKFQGQEEKMSFGELLGIHDCDDVGTERLTELSRIIDVDTLVQLIREQEIKIGSEVEDLGQIEDYYIPRTMVRHGAGDIEHEILDVDELAAQNNKGKIVVLTGAAGLGKSTALTYLAGRIKQNVPSMLVIVIDLNQKTRELVEEQQNRSFDNNDTKGAVDFLVDKLSSIKPGLESQVFKTLIKDRGNAALLFDGFDEISLSYADTVIYLLQTLAKLRIKNLFITTRPHAHKKLKDRAETGRFPFAFYTLRPFSDANQTKFLYKFWKRRLSLDESDVMTEERLEIHAQNVIDLLTRSINHHMKEFTGVPFQTRLVAENFQYPLELPKQIDVIDLYRGFVKKKYDIYHTEKKRADSTNQAKISDLAVDHKIFIMTHQKFALEALFEEEAKLVLSSQPKVESCLDLYQSVIEGGESTGIITGVIEGKPYFIHRTCAEYFSAEFLFKTLMDDSRNQHVRGFFLKKLFVESKYSTIRCFLEFLLRDVSHAPEKEPWELRLRENCDDSLGQTVYHIAAEERNLRIISFFRNRLSPTLRNTTGLNDQFMNQPTLLVEIENEGSGSVGINIKISQINEKLEQEADINIQNHFGETPLHAAVKQKDNLEMVKYLLEIRASVNSLAGDGATPLHDAVSQCGNLDVVKYLLDNGAKVNLPAGDGRTPLHYAVVQRDNLDIVKYLLEIGAKIDSLAKDGMTPIFHAVCQAKNLDVVKHLVETRPSIINSVAANGKTLLQHAVRRGKDSDVKNYLLEKDAKSFCR